MYSDPNGNKALWQSPDVEEGGRISRARARYSLNLIITTYDCAAARCDRTTSPQTWRKMNCTTVMHPEETSCPFRLLVAGTGDREIRMLDLAPVFKEDADDSKCEILENLDGYSRELEKDNSSATEQMNQQPCGEANMPKSSGPPDQSIEEELEESKAHDSGIEDSAIVKRPSLTSIDSGVVIEAEELFTRPHTPTTEIEVPDKASSLRIEYNELSNENALPVEIAREDIVSWTLTSDYDENKPVSAPCPSYQRLFAQADSEMPCRS